MMAFIAQKTPYIFTKAIVNNLKKANRASFETIF